MRSVSLAPALVVGGYRVASVGILIALIVMRHQGINANIMSLGGIAIAIGAMVDAAGHDRERPQTC
jgi:Cu/Ag efflux pump CusA